MSPRGPGARSRISPVIAGAAIIALAMLVVPSPSSSETAGASAAPAGRGSAGAAPGVDEVVSSENMRLRVNVPKQAPFDVESALATDIAFQGDYAFDGNYRGFTIYDIRRPDRPRIVSQVVCPGGQNDVTVDGNLLVLSTDSPRTNNSCQSEGGSATDPNSWEGVKIFDISDKRNPRYVAAVRTKCGSHTHTLVPDRTGKDVYVYVSSYAPSDAFPNCRPPHDQISIVKIPRNSPETAAIVAEPVLFPDGGNPNSGGLAATTGCHDITVYPEKRLAAGACLGDGVLMDISDPVRPRVIHATRDSENFAFWHSATFSNQADKVVFTDELGGGVQATCNAATGPNRGANGVYEITGKGDERKLVLRSYFKIPRHQADSENCVAHNGSLIPAKGRDIMVQAWYQGGMSVWDFTDARHPKEIGFLERGPLPNEEPTVGGSWSAYYYNGFIYSSDIQKGLDVVDIRDSRTDSAKNVRLPGLNAQTQRSYRE